MESQTSNKPREIHDINEEHLTGAEIEARLKGVYEEIGDAEDDDFHPMKSYQEIYYQDEDDEENKKKSSDQIVPKSLDFPPDIIVVGSGPVGIWTAIQIKLLIPKYQILLLDKHQTYARNHLLRIIKKSLKQIDSTLDKSDFRKFAEKLIGKIKTNDLERLLWAEAEKLGIKKEIIEVVDVKKLKTDFPTLKFIIGCDGSHSNVRKEIFDNKLSVKETIEYVVFVKYEVEGKAEKLKLTENYAGLKLIKHLVYESVGKMSNNTTPVTLQIKIDAETYNKMGDCKFKTPYNITTDKKKFEEKLLETITVWLNMRSKLNGEKRINDSVKVTTVNLDVYRSESVGKYLPTDNVAVFLCGDSASGVPFFRALNNGMQLGSYLAKTMKDNENAVEKAIDNYNRYFDSMISKEIRRAKTIAWAHKAAETAVKLNSKVPWQFFSLKKIKKELTQPLQSEEN